MTALTQPIYSQVYVVRMKGQTDLAKCQLITYDEDEAITKLEALISTIGDYYELTTALLTFDLIEVTDESDGSVVLTRRCVEVSPSEVLDEDGCVVRRVQ